MSQSRPGAPPAAEAAQELRCPTCGGRVRIERVRQELDPPFVQPGGPIVRRATCEDGHVTWVDD